MATQTIDSSEIYSFLHDEGYYAKFPLGTVADSMVFSRRGVPDIIVPDKEVFTHEEVVGKILNRPMFNQLLEYLSKH